MVRPVTVESNLDSDLLSNLDLSNNPLISSSALGKYIQRQRELKLSYRPWFDAPFHILIVRECDVFVSVILEKFLACQASKTSTLDGSCRRAIIHFQANVQLALQKNLPPLDNFNAASYNYWEEFVLGQPLKEVVIDAVLPKAIVRVARGIEIGKTG